MDAERADFRRRAFLHSLAVLVLAAFWYWPGGLLFNRIEPVILGMPTYVFWTLLLLPILNMLNFILYYRHFLPLDSQTQRLQSVRPGPVPADGIDAARTEGN